jgi:hypothetical protein
MSSYFGIRCLFQHEGLATTANVYEERIVLVKAAGPEEAILVAESEARDYAEGLGDANYLEFLQAFHLFDEPAESPSEVFSLMRESDLGPNEYIDRHFATGGERERSSPDSAA